MGSVALPHMPFGVAAHVARHLKLRRSMRLSRSCVVGAAACASLLLWRVLQPQPCCAMPSICTPAFVPLL